MNTAQANTAELTMPPFEDVEQDIQNAHINHVLRDMHRVMGDAITIARSHVMRRQCPTGKDSLDAYYQAGQVTLDMCCQLACEIVPIVASSYYSSQQSHYSRQALDKEDIEQFLYEKVLNRYLANIRATPCFYLVSSFRKSFYTSCVRECMGHYRMFIRNHGRGTLRTRLVHIDADNGNGAAIQLVADPDGSEPTVLNAVVGTLLKKHSAPRMVCVWNCPRIASSVIETGHHARVVRTIGECGDFLIGNMSPAIKKVAEATGVQVVLLPDVLVERTATILQRVIDGMSKSSIRKALDLPQTDFNEAWECAESMARTHKANTKAKHIVSDTAGFDTYSSFDAEHSLADA